MCQQLTRIMAAERSGDEALDGPPRQRGATAPRSNWPWPIGISKSALALAVIDNLRNADPDRRVDVTIEPGLSARGDVTLLRAALDNLLDNAWKFTSQQSPGAHRAARGRSDNGMRTFRVADNGAGFDMAHAEPSRASSAVMAVASGPTRRRDAARHSTSHCRFRPPEHVKGSSLVLAHYRLIPPSQAEWTKVLPSQ